ncbi:MAG: glycosyltransferase family 4 protein [Planctomycetota bacterium]|jgi:glycosyltransferase involved in cell wall biosynthesis
MGDRSKRKLTVLQLVPEMEAGGVERGALEVCEALAGEGHRAIVVSSGGRLVDRIRSVGGEHISLAIAKKSPLTLRHAGALRRIIEQQGVDILHARSRVPAWVAWRAMRSIPERRRPRYVTTIHGLYSVSWYSRIMTRSDHIVCVSNAAREYALRNYGSELDARITVIPRGVDPEEFPFGHRPDADWAGGFLERFPMLRGRRVLTLPGRVTRLKGHADFIELVAALVEDGHDVAGLIIGSVHRRKRAYLDSLRRQIERAGLGERVAIAPPTDRIRDVYALSTIVYSLSRTPESFGRTVLEPLTMGVPVIGYDHGGVGEILGELCTPGLVALGDAASLVDRSRDFLSSPPAIASTHSLTKGAMLGAILELYKRLAGVGPAVV